MEDAIGAVRSAFADYFQGTALNQPRRRLILPTGAVLHSMAGTYRGYFGTKVYSTHAKHGAHFTFLFYDAATAAPLAQFEANHLGQIRTGAASGVAAAVLAPDREIVVAVIGSGFQARTQLEAVASVRPVKQARVWSRDPAKRESYAEEMSRFLRLPVLSSPSTSHAAAGADVIITATYSKDPVIETEDVRGNALIIAVGSNNPQRRELPSSLVQGALIIVDDLDACRLEAGDLLLGLPDAAWQNVIELKNLVGGKTKAGRGDRLTVFKSVGLGLEDVAAAAVVYEKAILEPTPADRNRATR
jgi:ornithine cyclodeaminase/alanine dehydrogenase-like protein (mu-crystallin family)